MRMFFHADDDGKVCRIYARATQRWARLTIRDPGTLEIHLLDGTEIVRRIGGELGIWWAQRVACDFVEKGV